MKLEIVNLSKTYNKTKALRNFSFTFTEGVYGLLGPNGSGKSTLMNIMTDNLEPTCGEIIYDGKNYKKMGAEYRKILGYMPQQQGLYPGFTIRHFLKYMAELKGIKKDIADNQIDDLLNKVNLKKYENNRMGSLSGGMKQRVLIAQAMLGDPKIVILDEPTAGLDPKERIRIRNIISMFSLHRIVIIATHVVSDIEYIAREVILLNEGSVKLSDTATNMCSFLEGKVFEVHCKEEELCDLYKTCQISNITNHNGDICVRMISDTNSNLQNASIVKPMLEDVYLYYFNGESAYEFDVS